MLRSLTAERLLAFCAAAVGVMGIVSAATPEMADRTRLLRGVLPPGWPEGARVLTMACAIGLVFLARSLAQRRHRAWQLAVLVVVASAAAHLAKGLDFEEATISLAPARRLIHWRSRSTCRATRQASGSVLGLGAALARRSSPSCSPSSFAGTTCPTAPPTRSRPSASSLGFAALYFWLRPFGQRVAQSVGERRVVRALVETYGTDSLVVLRAPPRQELLLLADAAARSSPTASSPARRSMSGDPVGEERGARRPPRGAAAARARARLAARGRRRPEQHLPRYRALGLQADPDRRRGGAAAGGVLARGPRDPQGAPVGHAPAEGRLPRSASSPPTTSSPSSRRSSRACRTSGAATSPSAASRWRSTTSTCPARCSRSRPTPDGRVGGFLHLAPSPAGGGFRCRRCAAGRIRRTG